MTSTHVVLRRNALLISSDELGDGGVSYHVPVWLFAPDRSNHEEFDATGVTNHGSKVAQLHLKICDKQRVIDVGPYGGQYRACSRAKRRHKTHNCIKRTAAGLSEAHCGHTFFYEPKRRLEAACDWWLQFEGMFPAFPKPSWSAISIRQTRFSVATWFM